MRESDVAYFNRERIVKNPIFFSRFPNIKYEGLKILDLGCGHGAISIDLAIKGAKEVTGIDLDNVRISFANENLAMNFPEFADRVSFKCMDLRMLPDDDFDQIISKAAFEHIMGLDTLLYDMAHKLKVGGQIVSGFGPLYNSPWGDHNRLHHKLPWAHLIFGEEHFIKKLNKSAKQNIKNIHDLNLNAYSFRKYMHAFYNTKGLLVVDLRTNVGDKLLMKLFRLLAKISFLREYFTYNIYCVLQRTV